MTRFVIVADDFTGANDTGVQFSKVGYKAVTVFDPASNPSIWFDYDVVVVDTETRGVTPEEARVAVARIAESLKYAQNALIYKKVDSTLRGNIGEEVLQLAESLQAELVVFAPAYPKLGRTTVGGTHMLNGVPVHLTEIGRDPKNPVKASTLSEVLSQKRTVDVVSVGLHEIRSDLRSRLRSLSAKTRFFAFDAEQTDDLLTIVDAVMYLGKRTLWVGSAGLAEAIMLKTTKTPQEAKQSPFEKGAAAGTSKTVLFVIGSVSTVTRRQLRRLLETERISMVEVDLKEALTDPSREIERLTQSVSSLLNSGKNAAVASAAHDSDVPQALEIGRKLNINSAEVSKRLAQVVGRVCSRVIPQTKPKGLFLTGGDTAYNVLSMTNISGCMICGEVESGVPELVLVGGCLDGLRCITKAGAFGNDDTMIHALNVLERS